MVLESLRAQGHHPGGRQRRPVVGGTAPEEQLLRPHLAALWIHPQQHHPLAVGQLRGAGPELLEVEHQRTQLRRVQPLHRHPASFTGELRGRRSAPGQGGDHLAPVVERPLPAVGDRFQLQGVGIHGGVQAPRAASTALATVRSKRVVSLMFEAGASSTRTGSPSRS